MSTLKEARVVVHGKRMRYDARNNRLVTRFGPIECEITNGLARPDFVAHVSVFGTGVCLEYRNDLAKAANALENKVRQLVRALINGGV